MTFYEAIRYEIVNARYIKEYKIELTFDNGRKGVVDFRDYAGKDGVFARFTDIEYFKQFSLNKELGVLTWPDDVDSAPEVLYHEATGEPLPGWMEKEEDLRAV